MPIQKAVFPVAGLGTRFLPATKANPKEMLPIVDKPLIQYAVEEAIAAGVSELIFVTSSTKRAIEDHFDRHFELEYCLKQQGKLKQLQDIQNIVPKGVHCVYVRQPEMLGLGHAILCASEVVGNNPFAVILADDLIKSPVGALSQMVQHYDDTGHYNVAVQTVAQEETEKYGIVSTDSERQIQAIVEKPAPEAAPSRLGVVGRYVLPPEVFAHLRRTTPGAGGEIQLTDALSTLLSDCRLDAFAFAGKRYDCGNKLDYLKATLDYGCQHPEVGEQFSRYMRSMLEESVV